jgi:hypothetical protein
VDIVKEEEEEGEREQIEGASERVTYFVGDTLLHSFRLLGPMNHLAVSL